MFDTLPESKVRERCVQAGGREKSVQAGNIAIKSIDPQIERTVLCPVLKQASTLQLIPK